jgi:hypothetical protein
VAKRRMIITDYQIIHDNSEMTLHEQWKRHHPKHKGRGRILSNVAKWTVVLYWPQQIATTHVY